MDIIVITTELKLMNKTVDTIVIIDHVFYLK